MLNLRADILSRSDKHAHVQPLNDSPNVKDF